MLFSSFCVLFFLPLIESFAGKSLRITPTKPNSNLKSSFQHRMVVEDAVDERVKEMPKNRDRPSFYRGACFVVGDNIDTDQIIPAEYLTLVPTKPDEYEKLGSYAMIGLPDKYKTRYVPAQANKTPYPIIIGGKNFGCGSSREHAPIALGAAGNRVVVAESFARIFFRNCIATGELYPYETPERLVESFTTGDDVTVDLDKDTVENHTTGKIYQLQPLGDAGPVIKAGGLFPYALKEGMIKK
mmetsp:Transcript_10623/g.15916  ORF Transcript_10623/g.15916 Transcript_10623/m.15916 type:complete len:242 (-) Transcript_10623:38-763(-)